LAVVIALASKARISYGFQPAVAQQKRADQVLHTILYILSGANNERFWENHERDLRPFGRGHPTRGRRAG
jgi:hypothetical protein